MKIEPKTYVFVKTDVEDSKTKEIFQEGRSTHDVATDHFKKMVNNESNVRNGMRAVMIWF
ncbi:hypothetical protein [Criblamydia sequanensis]|uniref:Uncharacterized protein n=1 Tax=Candidatus Criblamydia sequanensis CRIB-18 TaxID=1437425 RepID=A0A090D0H2_9BACT|nr:hypothetical protein [Criblamydia sequanensis]CDR35037.1 hypothetical protein CSEC_2231 [Criblamydia sequanensis CRIB-18]